METTHKTASDLQKINTLCVIGQLNHRYDVCFIPYEKIISVVRFNDKMLYYIFFWSILVTFCETEEAFCTTYICESYIIYLYVAYALYDINRTDKKANAS